jgi:hypothetical protein
MTALKNFDGKKYIEKNISMNEKINTHGRKPIRLPDNYIIRKNIEFNRMMYQK